VVTCDPIDRVENELAEPFLLDRPVVPLETSILLGFAELDIENAVAMFGRPGLLRKDRILGRWTEQV
jgi:hypothetical protein